MKNWDNPDIVELNIKSTSLTETTERYADDVDRAPDGHVIGVIQGISESGPQMRIDDFKY